MTLEIPDSLRPEWEIIHRGTAEVVPGEELLAKLIRAREQKRPLRIKYGADPSAPDLHLGHMVPIRKMRQFQDLGHQIIFIIGDFTAMIGDPSGVSQTRPQLSPEEVAENARTYLDQIYKVLDPEKTQVVYNSSWLGQLSARAVIELAAKYTVARMLERDDFSIRFKSERPIFVHELLYPLYQGYDSVCIEADLELGGTDQKFNFMVARELQRNYGQEPQIVLTMPLLVGIDGVKKMSKSLGNYIGITDPPRDMYGKTMRIGDETMWDFFALVLDYDPAKIDQMRQGVVEGRLHPRDVKGELAREIVTIYHNRAAADEAAEEFIRLFREHKGPDEIEAIEIKAEGGRIQAHDLLCRIGLAESKRDAKRLIQSRAVDIDGRTFEGSAEVESGEHLIKVGKYRFKKVLIAGN